MWVVVCVLPRASVWVEEDERKEAIFILYNCITTLNTIAGIYERACGGGGRGVLHSLEGLAGGRGGGGGRGEEGEDGLKGILSYFLLR